MRGEVKKDKYLYIKLDIRVLSNKSMKLIFNVKY